MLIFAPSTCVECGTDGQNGLTWGAQKIQCIVSYASFSFGFMWIG